MIPPSYLQRDVRFRAIIDHIAYTISEKATEADDREAIYRIAHETANALLTFIYDEDREISVLRHERDHFRDAYFELAMRTPTMPLPLQNND